MKIIIILLLFSVSIPLMAKKSQLSEKQDDMELLKKSNLYQKDELKKIRKNNLEKNIKKIKEQDLKLAVEIVAIALNKMIPDIKDHSFEDSIENIKNSEERLFFEYVYHGKESLVVRQLKKIKDVNVVDKYHQSAIVWAILNKNENITKILIENGAKLNISTMPRRFAKIYKFKLTPLLIAVDNSDAAMIDLLVKKGASKSFVPKDGVSLLMGSIIKDNKALTKKLINEEIAINETSYFEFGSFIGLKKLYITPLEFLAKTKKFKLVEHLLSKNVIVPKCYYSIQGRCIQSVLNILVENNQGALVFKALEKGADPNIQFGYSMKYPILLAVEKGYLNIVKMLVKKKAQLDVIHHDEKTSLLISIEKNSFKIFTYLLKNNADINYINYKDGRMTALFLAAKHKRYKMFDLILKKRPDFKHKIYTGNDIFKYVKSLQDKKLILKLRKYIKQK